MFDELILSDEFLELQEKYGECFGIDEEDLIQILEGGIE